MKGTPQTCSVALATLLLSSPTFAIYHSGISRKALDLPKVTENAALIHYDDGRKNDDSRETFEDYARSLNGGKPPSQKQIEETYKKYEATGLFRCGRFTQNANLICRSKDSCQPDLLVLNTHAFYDVDRDKGICKKIQNLQNCYFEYKSFDGQIEKFYIDPQTIHTFTSCPDLERSKDIALVKLHKPVVGVAPYPVYDFREADSSSIIKTEIIVVSKYNGNFRNYPPPTSSVDHTCQMLRQYIPPNEGEYVLVNNCSAELGSSGAANLIENPRSGKLELFGIFGESLGQDRDHLPFGKHNYTGTVPFFGDVYSALELPRLTGNTYQPTDAQDPDGPAKNPTVRLGCQDIPKLKSIASGIPTTETFYNSTKETVSFFWLDYNGSPQFYGTLKPFRETTQNTYVDHPWVFRSSDNSCLGVYVPKSNNERFIIGNGAP
jgi:hypothetical protein